MDAGKALLIAEICMYVVSIMIGLGATWFIMHAALKIGPKGKRLEKILFVITSLSLVVSMYFILTTIEAAIKTISGVP